MPVSAVAVEADVSTSPGEANSPPSGFDPGGSWAKVSLQVETLGLLTIDGSPVAWKASADFSYTGTTGGTATSTSPPTTVTLDGSSSSLTVTSKPLLRDGDTTSDSFGNTISVSASRPLRSA